MGKYIRGKLQIRRRNIVYTGLLVLLCFISAIIYLNIREEYNDQEGRPAEMSDKWIVITSISLPTKDIEALANIIGWKVVVVGDLKTPSNWSYPGCSYLSVKQQQELGYSIVKHLPHNSYTRKNIGYLYAIQHGARYIYDTDDDNHPTNGKIDFYQSDAMSGLIYSNGNMADVMNPYAHFGQPTIWPRGYPLELISKPNTNTYKLCTYKTPAIQQGLVNGDPDVDAIFRLTRKTDSQHFNIEFDSAAPPVILPEGIFSPFNSQNTHFAYEAFWALFLPTTVAFRVTDIWRGLWAQKLLWLIGQSLAFLPPNAIQIRNAHNYLEDFKDETQFYVETLQFIKFLKNWTCQEITFFACVSRLSHDMVFAKFWAQSDATLIDLWLSDLVKIGFKEPLLVNKTISFGSNCLNGYEEEKRTIYYSPIDKTRAKNEGFYDLNVLFSNYLTYTPFELGTCEYLEPTRIFKDILLIIVFNAPFFKNIPMLEALYRDHFPNIVYCGEAENYTNVKTAIGQSPFLWKKKANDFSFINITMENGYYGYECAIRAMEMNYNVDGYMILGDDVVLNLWNLYNLDTKYVQLQATSNRYYNRFLGKSDIPWRCWHNGEQKKLINAAFTELEILSKSDHNDRRTNSIKQCLSNRYDLQLNTSIVAFGMSDFYYIPRTLSYTFIDVMKVLLKHKIFLELGLPTAATCLQNETYFIESFSHESIWFAQRLEPLNYYKDSLHCFHPIKLSELHKNETLAEQYSEKYVKKLLDNW